MKTAPITTISPIIPAGVFNVSVKSKINPISVLPILYIFEKCHVEFIANGMAMIL
jgi:hypothetical protein